MGASFEMVRAEAGERWNALTAGSAPWIRIGAALCGKAAGADGVTAAIRAELESRGIEATVSEVGCLGLCYAEPLVDIMLPGGPRVFYGNTTPLPGAGHRRLSPGA